MEEELVKYSHFISKSTRHQLEEPYPNKSSFPGAWVINYSNYKLLIHEYTFHLSSIAGIRWACLADVQIADYNLVRRDFEGKRDYVQRESLTVQKQFLWPVGLKRSID